MNLRCWYFNLLTFSNGMVTMVGLNPKPVTMKFPTYLSSHHDAPYLRSAKRCSSSQMIHGFIPQRPFLDHNYRLSSIIDYYLSSLSIIIHYHWTSNGGMVQLGWWCPFGTNSDPSRILVDITHQLWLMLSPFLCVKPVTLQISWDSFLSPVRANVPHRFKLLWKYGTPSNLFTTFSLSHYHTTHFSVSPPPTP